GLVIRRRGLVVDFDLAAIGHDFLEQLGPSLVNVDARLDERFGLTGQLGQYAKVPYRLGANQMLLDHSAALEAAGFDQDRGDITEARGGTISGELCCQGGGVWLVLRCWLRFRRRIRLRFSGRVGRELIGYQRQRLRRCVLVTVQNFDVPERGFDRDACQHLVDKARRFGLTGGHPGGGGDHRAKLFITDGQRTALVAGDDEFEGLVEQVCVGSQLTTFNPRQPVDVRVVNHEQPVLSHGDAVRATHSHGAGAITGADHSALTALAQILERVVNGDAIHQVTADGGEADDDSGDAVIQLFQVPDELLRSDSPVPDFTVDHGLNHSVTALTRGADAVPVFALFLVGPEILDAGKGQRAAALHDQGKAEARPVFA